MCGRPKVLKRLIYPSARKEFLVPEAKDGVKGLLPPKAERGLPLLPDMPSDSLRVLGAPTAEKKKKC